MIKTGSTVMRFAGTGGLGHLIFMHIRSRLEANCSDPIPKSLKNVFIASIGLMFHSCC
jgi:hypothetical protein